MIKVEKLYIALGILEKEVEVEEIENTIKNTPLTAYEIAELYSNKDIKYLSGSYAPKKLANVLKSKYRITNKEKG